MPRGERMRSDRFRPQLEEVWLTKKKYVYLYTTHSTKKWEEPSNQKDSSATSSP